MKNLFLSVAIFVGLLLVEVAGAQVCGSLFSTEATGTHVNRVESFPAMYFKNALQVSKSDFKPGDLQLQNVLAKDKFDFVKKHSRSLEKILAEGDVSLTDIIKAEVFEAQSLSTNGSKLHSHVMAVGPKIYSFDFEGKSYRLLNQTQVGFLARPTVEILKLNNKILRIQNSDVQLFDGTLKDPLFLSILAKAGKLSPELEPIYAQFRTEITDMLLNSTLTIPELMESTPIKTKTENNDIVFIIPAQNHQYYLSSKAGIINKDNAKRWGVLSLSQELGYSPRQSVRLTTDAKQEMAIENNVLKLSRDVRSMNLYLSLVSVIKDSRTSSYRSEFIEKHQETIANLITKNSFVEAEFYSVIKQLEVIVSTAEHVFYMLPSKSGEMFFDVGSTKWGYVKDLPASQFGKSFYTSKGMTLQIGQSMGFNSQRVVRTLISENQGLSEKAFLAKISLALKEESLTINQSAEVLQVRENLVRSGFYAEDNVVPPHVISNAAFQIKEALSKDSLFKPAQVDEILKVLF